MPNFLIAPDSFKGTIASQEVCDIIEKAITDCLPDSKVKKLPVADGGEGLLCAMRAAKGGEIIKAAVRGPFGEPMESEYLLADKNTAVIEMAACAGLPLVGEKENPLLTTTLGVGDFIRDALRKGVNNILLGLGGSATNDCGMGMAQSLGYQFLDSESRSLEPVGNSMIRVKKILPPPNMPDITFTAACDVENPLFGPDGAAYVFAPQKGADGDMVMALDNGLRNMAEVIKTDLGIDVSELRGAGSAGGLGAGVAAFLKGTLRSGIDLLLDAAGFDELLENTDIVITGEGCMDFQTTGGKVPFGVARRAAKKGCRVIAVCGVLGDGAEKMHTCGISAMYASRKDKADIETLQKTCRQDLYAAAITAIKDLNL
jgi:glycerate kinase